MLYYSKFAKDHSYMCVYVRVCVYVCVCVCVYSGLTSLSTIFSHITTVSGCDRELNAHFYRTASQKYHVPDT